MARGIKVRDEDGDDEMFSVGQDARGYDFCGTYWYGLFRVDAGCHSLTVGEARKYWSEPGYSMRAAEYLDWVGDETPAMAAHRARQRLPHIIRMLDAIEAEALKRGWLPKPRKAKAKPKSKVVKRKAVKKKPAAKKLNGGTMEPWYMIYDRFGENIVS